jgi:hypothetical protein
MSEEADRTPPGIAQSGRAVSRVTQVTGSNPVIGWCFSVSFILVDKTMELTQALYAEMPNGKVIPIDWVSYERLKAFGWKHRIQTETQAVLHSLKYLKKGK